MTVKKSLKRAVRARMSKTGERYTAARRQVIAKADQAEPGPSAVLDAAPGAAPALELAPQPDQVPESAAGTPADAGPVTSTAPAGMQVSDEAMQRRTGRVWEEWFALLDAWGGAERKHPEIARWLEEEHQVSGWWAQSITVGYERARGMRAPHQLVDGFSANASKTVNVPVEALYRAFADETDRARWLPDAPLTVRTAREPKALYVTWRRGESDESRADIGFTAKGESKSQVAVQHVRLADAAATETMKAFWRERLAALKEMLEGKRALIGSAGG